MTGMPEKVFRRFQTSQGFQIGVELFAALEGIQFCLNQLGNLLSREDSGGLCPFNKIIRQFYCDVHDGAYPLLTLQGLLYRIAN